MNDLKQEFIDKQLALNNELESKVDIRTADLRKTSEKLTAANNDINKSIQAASVIQNAILPRIDLLHYGFRDLEYVWQPRDTIGGDFYWLEKKDGWTCLVVADCTGHGIPGAFKTLISSTLLGPTNLGLSIDLAILDCRFGFSRPNCTYYQLERSGCQ